MARPVKRRRVCARPNRQLFGPLDGTPAGQVQLGLDEFEALRLIDLLGLTQAECADRMGVARTTVQAVYDSARHKVAAMLAQGLQLQVAGGCYRLCGRADACCASDCAGHGCTQPLCMRLKKEQEDGGMKLAITYENGQVFGHFGHTAQFKVYDIEGGKIVASRVVDTAGSGHGALAGFLKGLGVDTLICGGIGGGARTALAQAGITLYPGAQGSADAQAQALLDGTLQYDPDTMCAHHDHHGEGHSCGSHGEGHDCRHGNCGS